MPAKEVYTRYRPTRVSDGRGGFTEVLASPITFYGRLQLFKDKLVIVDLDGNDDVKVGDVILAKED